MSLGSTSAHATYVPTMACNVNHLDILHEPQVDFANLIPNGFNFIEDFASIEKSASVVPTAIPLAPTFHPSQFVKK